MLPDLSLLLRQYPRLNPLPLCPLCCRLNPLFRCYRSSLCSPNSLLNQYCRYCLLPGPLHQCRPWSLLDQYRPCYRLPGPWLRYRPYHPYYQLSPWDQCFLYCLLPGLSLPCCQSDP